MSEVSLKLRPKSKEPTPEPWDENGNIMPWATEVIRYFSSSEAEQEEGSRNEPTDDNDDNSHKSTGFCCTFKLDRSGVTEPKFFFATDRHDTDTVIVGLHAMFDPNSGTLGLSCTPMFGVDRDGKELDGGNWDRESCEKAIVTIDTAFRTLRDDESLYIQLSHSAENLRKGSSIKFAQFCNTMLGRLRKDKFEVQGRTCHFLVRAAFHHPGRRTGSGPSTLDSLIQHWACGTGQRLSPANERLLQSRLIAGSDKCYTPPWIPNVVMGKEDIWKNGRISKART